MTKPSVTTHEESNLIRVLEDQILFASQSCLIGEEMTLAKICGKSFWQQFVGTEHNQLGSLMKKLVAARRVPFVFIRTNSSNHAVYERINTKGQ